MRLDEDDERLVGKDLVGSGPGLSEGIIPETVRTDIGQAVTEPRFEAVCSRLRSRSGS
jgi:hypothetical protein